MLIIKNHQPVMKSEVVAALNIVDGGVYFDGTLGGGGHTQAILSAHPNAHVIACDLDSDAIDNASELVDKYKSRLKVVKGNFKTVARQLPQMGVDKLDGVLLDLGVSSHQIDSADRGFSYRLDGRLDMRMDVTQELDAYTVVNSYSIEKLTDTIKNYGEEKFAYKIACKIAKQRQTQPIDTTQQLVGLIRQCIPYHMSQGHPAKKTFQAIRCEVNRELIGLDDAIQRLVELLGVGGCMCVLTFQSLEDRIVKNVFRQLSRGCICDKRLPVCVCANKPQVSVTPKCTASQQELQQNSRAKSAILRCCQKI